MRRRCRSTGGESAGASLAPARTGRQRGPAGRESGYIIGMGESLKESVLRPPWPPLPFAVAWNSHQYTIIAAEGENMSVKITGYETHGTWCTAVS